MERYANYLTEHQKFAPLGNLDSGISGYEEADPSNKTHFNLEAFGFSMNMQPSAFSETMFYD